KGVPQLLVSTGANKWNQPKTFRWSTPAFHLYGTEGEILAKYLLSIKPDAKVAILMQNDDFGRDYVSGFKKGLGDKASTMIVKEVRMSSPIRRWTRRSHNSSRREPTRSSTSPWARPHRNH